MGHAVMLGSQQPEEQKDGAAAGVPHDGGNSVTGASPDRDLAGNDYPDKTDTFGCRPDVSAIAELCSLIEQVSCVYGKAFEVMRECVLADRFKDGNLLAESQHWGSAILVAHDVGFHSLGSRLEKTA